MSAIFPGLVPPSPGDEDGNAVPLYALKDGFRITRLVTGLWQV